VIKIPKEVDDCVNSDKWSGKTNSKTGKPYTESEKYAICTAQMSKSSIVKVEDKYYFVSSAELVEALESAVDGTEIDIAPLNYDEKVCECVVLEAVVDEGIDFDSDVVESLTFRKDNDKITVHLSESVTSEPINSQTMRALGLTESELAEVQSVKPSKDGNFIVFAGMEGQLGLSRHPITGKTTQRRYSSQFFESRAKGFVGTSYYPTHAKKFDINAQLAKVVKSFTKKVGDKKKVVMLHEIKPRNEAVRSDIQEGYYRLTSIDVLKPVYSADDKNHIIDGIPWGTAFEAVLPSMLGCPQCGVISTSSEDEIESSIDTSSSGVSEQNIQESEPEMSKEKQVDAPPTKEEDVESVSMEKYRALESRMVAIEFGASVQSLVGEIGLESVNADCIMSIVSNQTEPSEKLEAVKSLVAAYDEKIKAIVASKVIEDKPEHESGTDDDSDSAVKRAEEVKSIVDRLEGKPKKRESD